MSVLAVVITGLVAQQVARHLVQRRPGYRRLVPLEVWLGVVGAVIGGSITGSVAARHWLLGFDTLTMIAACLYAVLVIAACRVLKEHPHNE